MTAATKCGFEVLLHLPYSPDVAPSDFYLFPKLKSNLRGTQFGSKEGVIAEVNEYLGDQEKGILFGRDKQARTEMNLVRCFEAGLISFNFIYIEK